jgi:hypothetical protein
MVTVVANGRVPFYMGGPSCSAIDPSLRFFSLEFGDNVDDTRRFSTHIENKLKFETRRLST